jgi:hypothetical protein
MPASDISKSDVAKPRGETNDQLAFLSSAGLVVLAGSLNPIPSRTRPLNSPAPMVLSLKTWKSRSLPGLPRTEIPLHDQQISRSCPPRSKKPPRETVAAFCIFSSTHVRVGLPRRAVISSLQSRDGAFACSDQAAHKDRYRRFEAHNQHKSTLQCAVARIATRLEISHAPCATAAISA